MRSAPLSLWLVLGQAINGALSGKPVHPWPVKRVASQPVIDAESSLNPRNVLSMSSLQKRRDCTGCSSGYCCADDTCVDSLSDECCGGFSCSSPDQCCHDGCIEIGDECCKSGGHCKSGYECYLVEGEPMCCPGGDCDDGGLISPGEDSGSGGGGSSGGGDDDDSSIGGGDSDSTSVYSTSLTITVGLVSSTVTLVSVSATGTLDASISFNSMSRSISSSLASENSPSLPTETDPFGDGDFDDLPFPTGFEDDPDRIGGGIDGGDGGGGGGGVGGGIGGGGGYPYPAPPAGYTGATAGMLWRTGFTYWYTTVYAGMILVPALLAVYI